MVLRFGHQKSLVEIAKKFNISDGRVGQIIFKITGENSGWVIPSKRPTVQCSKCEKVLVKYTVSKSGLYRCATCIKESKKICAMCGVHLTEENFGSRTIGGLSHHICRECNTGRAKKYRRTLKGGNNTRRISMEQYRKFIDKAPARAKLNRAVKENKIKRPEVCEVCLTKNNRIHGHHTDYSRPLDVIWLCPLCHKKRHQEMKGVMDK